MSNLRSREALERARQVFLQKPSAGLKPNAPATAAWRNDGLQCEVVGPTGERVVTDMPSAMGGDGAGPNPGWLLRASLASCAATAIAMKAARLGIELRVLEVTVQSESDSRGLTGIEGVSTALRELKMSIKIGADNVADDQLRALAQDGESQSPISCTLRDRPPVELEVSVV